MMGNDRMGDSSYVTRAELEEILVAYEVYDDGQTTEVSRHPGGTRISCTLPVSPADDPNPIFVSNFYTSSSCYSISWRDFDVQYITNEEPAPYTSYQNLQTISAGEFILERSVVGASVAIEIQVASIDNAPQLFWTNFATSGTISDSDTEKQRITASPYIIGTPIGRFLQPDSYLLFPQLPREIQYVNEGIFTIRNNYDFVSTGTYRTTYSQYVMPGAGASNVPISQTWSVSANTDDYLIVGWTQSTNAKTADIYANRASYDDYRTIAYVKTDADNDLRSTIVYARDVALFPFGETSTKIFVDNAGTTHTVKMANGLVTSWTTT